MDCPICMEIIEGTKNCIVTECGHSFHANCLMKSIAHNGFGCPYCRTEMAETPNYEDDDDSTYVTELDTPEISDYALRGFRFFQNMLNGNEHSEDDIEEENEEEDEINRRRENEQRQQRQQTENMTPISHIAEKLMQQHVSYEDLVSIMLLTLHDYESQELISIENIVYGKVRSIIRAHNPAQYNNMVEHREIRL